MLSKSVVLLLVLIIAGCVTTVPSPSPSPTTTPAPTPTQTPVPATKAPITTAPPTTPPPAPEPVMVQLSSVPASATVNQSFSVSWSVSGGGKGEITGASVRWDINPGKDARDYVTGSTVFRGKTPTTFNADMNAPSSPGVLYIRAFATVDGKEYSSDEETVRVGDVVHINIFDYPIEVRPEDLVYVRWQIEGGVPGKISSTELLWSTRSGAVPSDYLKYQSPTEEGAPQNLTGGEPPKFTEMYTGKTPQNFTVSFTAPSADNMLPEESKRVYVRVYAVVDGQEYLSEEKSVYVTLRHRRAAQREAICQANPTDPSCQ